MDDSIVTDLAAQLDALQKEVSFLRDRQAILDTIARYTRAVDRHEWRLLPTVYHVDGVANHGSFVGYYPDFIRWAKERFRTNLATHMHTIMNHNCRIDGDIAMAETYAVVYTVPKDGDEVHLLGARYIDRLSRRSGEWKIDLRRIALDWRCRAEGMADTSGFPHGEWGKGDLSYMDPLDLPPELLIELEKLDKPGG